MGKKSSNIDASRSPKEIGSPQLELSFVRKSAALVQFPKQRSGAGAKPEEASTLKRLLEYAATLPGK